MNQTAAEISGVDSLFQARAANGLRVLVYCAARDDSLFLETTLSQAGIGVRSCETFQQLREQIDDGTGALLIPSEGLSDDLLELLLNFIEAQPSWSDLPLIVLSDLQNERSRRSVDLLPAATILDRPLRPELLVRTVRAALRMRKRQYNLRDQLAEREDILSALDRANATEGKFLDLVSHELRTPASTIFGGARLMRLRGDVLDVREKDELLLDMEVESERLCNMIQDLLFLARADTENLRPAEPTLVQREIPHIVDSFQPLKGRRTIVLDLEEGLPAAACTTDLLHHVLTNLLSNADKYSPQGAPIEVAAIGRGDGVEIVLSDHGPGVPDNEVERIFDRFYRVEALARKVRGMGLGLTVCRRLVDAQNGEIWATRRPDGPGLQVHVRLPLYDAGDDLLV